MTSLPITPPFLALLPPFMILHRGPPTPQKPYGTIHLHSCSASPVSQISNRALPKTLPSLLHYSLLKSAKKEIIQACIHFMQVQFTANPLSCIFVMPFPSLPSSINFQNLSSCSLWIQWGRREKLRPARRNSLNFQVSLDIFNSLYPSLPSMLKKRWNVHLFPIMSIPSKRVLPLLSSSIILNLK